MAVFFAGRLWISPATMSTVDDSQMANQNLSVGNIVAFIGRSVGGAPNQPLRFGGPEEAKQVLIGGELLDAVLKSFDPSAQTGGPATVVAIRVNPATQSALTLNDVSSNPVIALKSTDYGLYTNQIKVKVEDGSSAGKKVTAQLDNAYFSKDNIARNAFSVVYSGSQSTAVLTVNNDTVTLQAPNGTVVASIDLNSYPTVQQLVDRINAVTDFTASVLDGSGDTPTLNGLDSVALQDVKTTTFNASANLQAIVDWINGTGEGYLTATRAANAGAVPINIPFTYLTGGSDGIVTNNQWSNAYARLQTVDAQIVIPVSSDPSIHAMNDTHVSFMSTIGRMERRGIVGTSTNTSDTAAIAAAKALNSDRTALVHLGYYDYDANGKLKLYPPYMTAALLGGMFAGVNPGTPLTNKTLKIRGIERELRNPTDTDVLIEGGVLCIENTTGGFKVVKSISTWLTNDNYNRVEMSVGFAVDFLCRNIRNALDELRGQKASPLKLSRAVSITDTTCKELAKAEPEGPGILAGDAANPPYKNIKAFLEGDVLGVQLQASPVLPINYIPITIFAVPYSGSATA